MYTMMNTTGFGINAPMFYGLHMIAFFLALLGMTFLLFWAWKHMTGNALWKWGWILLSTGIILCLLTFPAWSMFARGGMANGFGRGNFGMMGDLQNNKTTTTNATQLQEEADGKVLFGKLQAKETTCSDLTDNDFELIGEYIMGSRTGSSHEQMNNHIKQMMGEEGEMQMHIIIGRNATKCASGIQSSQAIRGMMNASGR